MLQRRRRADDERDDRPIAVQHVFPVVTKIAPASFMPGTSNKAILAKLNGGFRDKDATVTIAIAYKSVHPSTAPCGRPRRHNALSLSRQLISSQRVERKLANGYGLNFSADNECTRGKHCASVRLLLARTRSRPTKWYVGDVESGTEGETAIKSIDGVVMIAQVPAGQNSSHKYELKLNRYGVELHKGFGVLAWVLLPMWTWS